MVIQLQLCCQIESRVVTRIMDRRVISVLNWSYIDPKFFSQGPTAVSIGMTKSIIFFFFARKFPSPKAPVKMGSGQDSAFLLKKRNSVLLVPVIPYHEVQATLFCYLCLFLTSSLIRLPEYRSSHRLRFHPYAARRPALYCGVTVHFRLLLQTSSIDDCL